MTAAAGPPVSFLRSLQSAVSATAVCAIGAAVIYALTLPLDLSLLIIILPLWTGVIALLSFLPILVIGHVLASLRLGAIWFAMGGLVFGCAVAFLLGAIGWLPLHDMTGFLAVPAGLIGLSAFWYFDREQADG